MEIFFEHTVRIPDSDVSQTASGIAASAPDPSVIGYKHIGLSVSTLLLCIPNTDPRCLGVRHVYRTRTTVTIAPDRAALPPLWFFMRQHDDDHTKDCAHRSNIPHGFWSLEKHPISIPGDIAFDPTRRVESMTFDGMKAPVSSWTQVLDGLNFSIVTKYTPSRLESYRRSMILTICTDCRIGTVIMVLSKDEWMALGELHGNYSPSGTHFSDFSHDSDIASYKLLEESDHSLVGADDLCDNIGIDTIRAYDGSGNDANNSNFPENRHNSLVDAGERPR